MNKKNDKHPVPEDRSEHFMGIVWSLVEPFGIDQIPEAMDCVKLLSESIERYNFEKKYKISPQKKVHNDRAKFIAVFKSRYLEFTDLEYKRPITGVESKCINQANKTLQDSGFNCETYLKWTYDTFMVENEKFAPGTIKQVCSQVFLHKFLFEHKEQKDEKAKQDLMQKEGHMLLSKARTMIRGSDDKIFIENVRNLVKQYSDEDIMLSEFRKGLNKLAS
jgi:hypothetical protein